MNIGDEPVNNTIMGADFTYSRSSEFITNMLDKLPFLNASAPSSINVSAEAAYLIPGHSRAVGKEGNAYIDDFEGSQSAIDIRSWTQWSLASTPKLQPDLFPEGDVEDSLLFNFNRARLNWYTIDPSFFGGGLPGGAPSAAALRAAARGYPGGVRCPIIKVLKSGYARRGEYSWVAS